MTGDVRGSGKWIPEEEYEEITKKIPILCVDLLPLHPSEPGVAGLMLRETYWGRRGWCLVGGSVQHGEPAAGTVERVVRWSLGDHLTLRPGTLRLRDVVEYFPERETGEHFDPRKHAVALTYTAVLLGEPRARGKALDFRWFSRQDLPGRDDTGFDQTSLIAGLLDS